MVVADPSENLQPTIIADYRESDDDCCAELIGTVRPTWRPAPCRRRRATAPAAWLRTWSPPTTEKSGGVSLQADYSLGDQMITYIGSYREYDNTEIRDGDWLPRAYVGLNQLHDLGPQTSNTLTQELRLTSPADQFFSVRAGRLLLAGRDRPDLHP